MVRPPYTVRNSSNGLPQIWTEDHQTCISDRVFNGAAPFLVQAANNHNELYAALEQIAKYPEAHNMTGGGDAGHRAMVAIARAALSRCNQLETEKKKTITIIVEGGLVDDVLNLPPDMDYQVEDRDDPDRHDGGDNHCRHVFGPVHHSRFTGNPHRDCTLCGLVSLDLDEDDEPIHDKNHPPTDPHLERAYRVLEASGER